MTPLFGRPVMEHIITLLKRHHITDICVTLCYKPQAVMDYFGSGEQLGVQLTYFVEEEPLGTAGSVRNCLSHLGREDFLVISGDCVCDLDLTEAIQAHQERESSSTPTPSLWSTVWSSPTSRGVYSGLWKNPPGARWLPTW